MLSLHRQLNPVAYYKTTNGCLATQIPEEQVGFIKENYF